MEENLNNILYQLVSHSIVHDIVAIVIAAIITGSTTYFLRLKLEKGRYLPDTPSPDRASNYVFITDSWFLYHFTMDSKRGTKPILATSLLTFKLEKNFIVSGREEVQVNHRRSLEYLVRGQIRAGQFLFTAICTQDSSELYTGMFPNLLDDEASGMIVAKDYQRNLYSSPALLSKKKLTSKTAHRKLQATSVHSYIITNGNGKLTDA